MANTQNKLLDSVLMVLKIGMSMLYDVLQVQNIKVVQIDWKPSPVLDKLGEEILSKLCNLRFEGDHD